MTRTMRLAILPRDGLFFKDGRGWYTSHSGRGRALDWPWPSSIHGALCTAVGRQQEAETGSIKTIQEWLELKEQIRPTRQLALRRPLGESWGPEHRVWPVPRDAVWLEDNNEVVKLFPEPINAGVLSNYEDADKALWFPLLEESAKPLSPPRLWDDATFIDWLCEEEVTAKLNDEGKPIGLRLYRRQRVHVTIKNNTQTAKDKGLYTTEVLETLQHEYKGGSMEWALGVELEAPEVPTPRLATLGSDRRPAFVEELTEQLFAPPEKLTEGFNKDIKGLRLVIVTPTKFTDGWLPDGFRLKDNRYLGSLPGVEGEVILRAALVDRPLHVSGWDMANRRPKGTERVVPPGSVYFFTKANDQPFTKDEAQTLWLTNLGQRAEDGFGLVVPGIWQPQGEAS